MNAFAAQISDAATTRRAALLMHALPLDDRNWLWSQLSSADRSTLQPLLTELQSLGLAADTEIVRTVLAEAPTLVPQSAPTPASTTPKVTDQDNIYRLEQADPACLAAVMQDEPVGLIVRLFALRDWAWRDAVLMQMPPSKRCEVQQQLERMPAAATNVTNGTITTNAPFPHSHLARHLVASLLQRLEHHAFGLDHPLLSSQREAGNTSISSATTAVRPESRIRTLLRRWRTK